MNSVFDIFNANWFIENIETDKPENWRINKGYENKFMCWDIQKRKKLMLYHHCKNTNQLSFQSNYQHCQANHLISSTEGNL